MVFPFEFMLTENPDLSSGHPSMLVHFYRQDCAYIDTFAVVTIVAKIVIIVFMIFCFYTLDIIVILFCVVSVLLQAIY